MTFTINKTKNIQSQEKHHKIRQETYPNLTKILKQHENHHCSISVVKFGQVPHPKQCFKYRPWPDIRVQS